MGLSACTIFVVVPIDVFIVTDLDFTSSILLPPELCSSHPVAVLQWWKPGTRSLPVTVNHQCLHSATEVCSDHRSQRHIEVLVFLYWLAHVASYPVVSRAFGIHKSTVHNIIHQICKAVLALLKTVISLTVHEDLEVVGDDFSQLAVSPAFIMVVRASLPQPCLPQPLHCQ